MTGRADKPRLTFCNRLKNESSPQLRLIDSQRPKDATDIQLPLRTLANERLQ